MYSIIGPISGLGLLKHILPESCIKARWSLLKCNNLKFWFSNKTYISVANKIII